MDLVKLVFGRTPWYSSLRNFQHLLEALAAVVKYGYPARNLTVIGVTGTDGKTTTVHLIGSILEKAGYKTVVVSSIGAFFEGKQVDTGLHVTTPDSGVLQALLRRVHDAGITHVVIEVTSHGLDQHRVFGCNFKVGVLTNITHEHLDYHKTFENYRAAKAKLFKGVRIAVLNRDDGSFDYIKRVARVSKVISYGLTKQATILGKNVNMDMNGMEFVISGGKKKIPIRTNLLGDYNVSNILAAAGTALGFEISWNVIAKAVGEFKGMAGRLEKVENSKGFTIFIDFAHTPAALEELLKTLKKLSPKGKLIVVYGSAGERDREKRSLMGKVAVKYADFSVLTAEDPRSEDAEKIIDDITRGIRQSARVWDGVLNWRKGDHWCIRVPERGEAIAFTIQTLIKPGDVVVICGKGHEKSMAYGKIEYPWSDMEAAEVALKGRVMRVK